MSEPTQDQIDFAEQWLINYINEQKFKLGWKFEPATKSSIEEDALIYGYYFPELMARFAADMGVIRDAQ